eukprot:3659379-Pleurochrysis_carterae.AAC.2
MLRSDKGLYGTKRVCFQHSPVRGTGRRASTRDIHNRVAHREKNNRGGSDFVKKSAKLSVLTTNRTAMSWVSTRSRTKKWRREVGVSGGSPRSTSRSERKYTASFVASEAAMISASQEESATDGCCIEFQKMAAWLYMNM